MDSGRNRYRKGDDDDQRAFTISNRVPKTCNLTLLIYASRSAVEGGIRIMGVSAEMFKDVAAIMGERALLES